MARIRVIGKKEAPIAKRLSLGQKIYGKFKSIGQKVVDNRYVQGAAMAAASAAGAAIYKGAILPGIQSALAPGLSNAGVADIGSAPSARIPSSYTQTQNPLFRS